MTLPCEDQRVTIRDIILLLLGSIAGAVISSWYARGSSTLARALATQRIRRRAARDHQRLTVKRTLAYYYKCGLSKSLYLPRHIGEGDRLPLLADDSWLLSRPVDPRANEIIVVDDAGKADFKVNFRAIRRRRAQGARIFDGELVYLKSITQGSKGEAILLAGVCGYYAWATLSLRLEAELRWPWHRPSLHNRFFQNAASAISHPVEPLGIGCTCVTVFNGEDRLYVAVQNRSSEVMTDSSIRTVVPSFGLEGNVIGGRTSRFSLLYYNYFREFAEEFFDLESVIHASTSRRVDPDWILELPELKLLEREVRADRFRLECTGISVSPVGGFVDVALLAVSTSESFFNSTRRRAIANWEAARGGQEIPPIEFLELQSPKLDTWAKDGTLSPSSVFALDRARQRLCVTPDDSQ
jgi:hypothetical protein